MNESKFLELPPEVQNGIQVIANKIKQLPPSNGEVVTVGQIPWVVPGPRPKIDRGQPIANRTTYIRVDLVPNLSSRGSNSNHLIKLHDFETRALEFTELLNILSHEVTHAIDPKLRSFGASRYRQSVDKSYRQMIDAMKQKQQELGPDGDGTYELADQHAKFPYEFDALGVGIANSIRHQYTSLNDEEKPVFLQELETWLRDGGDPPRSIPNSNTMNLLAWQQKPTLWRKFQQRMYSLIQELKSL